MAVPTSLSTIPPSSPAQSDNEQPRLSAVPVASVANPSGAEEPKTQDTAGINQPSSSKTQEQKIVQALQKPEASNLGDKLTDWLKLARKETQSQTNVIKHYQLYLKHKQELPEDTAKSLGALFSRFDNETMCISFFNSYKRRAEICSHFKESSAAYFQSCIDTLPATTTQVKNLIYFFCCEGKSLSTDLHKKVLEICKELAAAYPSACGRLSYEHGVSNGLPYANRGREACEKYSFEDYFALANGTHVDSKLEVG